MKKLITLVLFIITLASCHQNYSPGDVAPAKHINPVQAYFNKSSDFRRILHLLKLDPSDIYSTYNSFVVR